MPAYSIIKDLIVLFREFGVVSKMKPGARIIIQTWGGNSVALDLLQEFFKFEEKPVDEKVDGVNLSENSAYAKDPVFGAKTFIGVFDNAMTDGLAVESLGKDDATTDKAEKGGLHKFSAPFQMVIIAPALMHKKKTNSLEAFLRKRGQLKVVNREHAFFDSADEQRLIYTGGHCDACINNSLEGTFRSAQFSGKKTEILLPLDQIYIGPEDFQGNVGQAVCRGSQKTIDRSEGSKV
jgi:hypothetical protein